MSSRGGRYPKGVARRAELLRTTLSVLERLGDSNSSMRTIATEAGISLAGLLHYFPTRDALMLALLEMIDEENVRSYEAAQSSGTPVNPAELFIAAMERNMTTPVYALAYISIVGASTNPGHPAGAHLAQRYETFRDAVAVYIRSEQAAGRIEANVDPEFAASSILAAVDGIQVQWLHDRTIDTAEHVRRTWQLLLGLPSPVHNARAPA